MRCRAVLVLFTLGVFAASIRAGEKVLKYGAVIGTATSDIGRGEHVHTHNLESDYLPTYTHEAGKSFVAPH